jgi:hypothetical protein
MTEAQHEKEEEMVSYPYSLIGKMAFALLYWNSDPDSVSDPHWLNADPDPAF